MTTKRGMRAFLVFTSVMLGAAACRLFNTPPSVQINGGDLTVENGVPAVFTATVTDPDRRATVLQWYLNDQEQTDANTDTFVVTLSPTVTTNYAVKVTANDRYATGSDEVTLIVKRPLLSVRIVEGDVTADSGQTVTFTTELTNPSVAAVSYRWFLDGAELASETSSSLSLTLSPSQAQVYTVAVAAQTSMVGASASVMLSVSGPFAVTIPGGDRVVENGAAAVLTVAYPETSQTVTLQWFVDDLIQTGATSSVFAFRRYQDVETTYTVRVAVHAELDGGQASAAVTVKAPAPFSVRHEILEGDSSYTLNLGSATRDVYFVFTNTTATAAPSQVTVTPQYGIRAPGPVAPRLTSVVQQQTQAPKGILRDRPEATEFNRTPERFVDLTAPARRSIVVPEPRRDAVEDVTSFMDDAQASLIGATCRKVVTADVPGGDTRTLNVWVADDCWTVGGSKAKLVSQDMVDAIASRFLVSGLDNDIYDWVTNVYGAEWGSRSSPDPYIAPDRQVTILLYDIGDDDSTTGGVVGYFWAKDNYLSTYVSFSNQRVMFYLDAVMFAAEEESIWEITDFWPQEMISTLAHEFQHMIHFYQKAVLRAGGQGSETWIEEMLSQATEDLVAKKMEVDGPRGVPYYDGTAGSDGNTGGRLPLYNYWIDTSLTDWLTSYPAVLKSYSTAYAFGAYLMRDFGGAELLRGIMHNAETSEAAVERALGGLGYQKSFEELLSMWGAAALLSDQVPGPGLYLYNSGGYLSSTIDAVQYQYGSINLFNYTYTEQGYVGPFTYTTSPLGTGNQAGTSNALYRAGTGLTGLVSWAISLPSGVRLTVVQK